MTDADRYFEHLPTLDGIQNSDGRYVWVSRSTPENWLGKTDREVQPPHLADTIEEHTKAFRDSPATTQVREARMVAGIEQMYLVNRFGLNDDKMGIHGIEIGAMVTTETQRAVADRLAIISEVSAGIAHEFNNPLTWIVGNLDYVNREMGRWRTPPPPNEMEDARDAIQEAVVGTARLRAFIKELRTFSNVTPTTGPIDLHRVVNSAIRMVGQRTRAAAAITRTLNPAPKVRADAALMEQVVLKLLQHATESFAKGTRGQIDVSVFTDTDGQAVLEVSDTGQGLSAQELAVIFQPFSTTQSGGMGLRLTLCQHIIESFQGEISVRSEQDNGTTFRIALPPMNPQANSRNQRRVTVGKKPAEDALRIMVIDDEPYVGSLLQRILHEHDVTLYQTGAAALNHIESGQPFDVILCDVMMDEMTGIEFHERLTMVPGELGSRVIFMTGGAYTPSAQEFLSRTTNACVAKPFNVEDLRNQIGTVANAIRNTTAI